MIFSVGNRRSLPKYCCSPWILTRRCSASRIVSSRELWTFSTYQTSSGAGSSSLPATAAVSGGAGALVGETSGTSECTACSGADSGSGSGSGLGASSVAAAVREAGVSRHRAFLADFDNGTCRLFGPGWFRGTIGSWDGAGAASRSLRLLRESRVPKRNRRLLSRAWFRERPAAPLRERGPKRGLRLLGRNRFREGGRAPPRAGSERGLRLLSRAWSGRAAWGPSKRGPSAAAPQPGLVPGGRPAAPPRGRGPERCAQPGLVPGGRPGPGRSRFGRRPSAPRKETQALLQSNRGADQSWSDRA